MAAYAGSVLAVPSAAKITLTGAGIVGVILIALPLMLLSGRLYCGWVCPINMVSDLAEALRRMLGWRGSLWAKPDRRLRYVVPTRVFSASTRTCGRITVASVTVPTISRKRMRSTR